MTMFARRHTPSGSKRTGTGEPVLLIHPFMLSHHSWRPVMERLAPDHDVMAVSMPGHYGGPPVSWRRSTFSHMVDHLERVMDAAGWETAHVAGNSLGGWATLELARRGRARTATAIAPAGGWETIRPRDAAMGLTFIGTALARPALRMTTVLPDPLFPVRRLALKAVAHDPSLIHPRDARHVVHAALSATHPLQVVAAVTRTIPWQGLEDVQAPVHLVFAERDRVIPPKRYAPYFTERLPHARVTTLKGMGHCPQIERPDVVADLIREMAGSQRLADAG